MGVLPASPPADGELVRGTVVGASMGLLVGDSEGSLTVGPIVKIVTRAFRGRISNRIAP